MIQLYFKITLFGGGGETYLSAVLSTAVLAFAL